MTEIITLAADEAIPKEILKEIFEEIFLKAYYHDGKLIVNHSDLIMIQNRYIRRLNL